MNYSFARRDLVEVTLSVVAELVVVAREKGVRIQSDLGPEPVPCWADADRLGQVIRNVLGNAIKFTPQAGAITVRTRAEGADHFRVEVQDSGVGIAPEAMGRLFVEFQQLDSSFTRKHQGTGLGLALTRRLVEAQGGSLGVSSVPGQGSTFHLVLPRITRAIDPA